MSDIQKFINKIDKERFFLIASLILIIIISLSVRFYDLTLDPFNRNEIGIGWGDEGAYIHNARLMALFNNWKIENDLLNPMYISPVHTYLEYISFKFLGVNTFAMRLLPAVLSFISILFASFLLFIRDKKQGVIFFVLLSLNTMLIAYSRIALLEYLVLFFILIILGLIINNKSVSWIFIGFLTPFLFFSKITSIFFIASIPISIIAYYLLYKDKRYISKLLNFLAGFLVSIMLWAIWWIPNFDDWFFMNFVTFGSRIGFPIYELFGRLFGVGIYSLKLALLMGVIIPIFIISLVLTIAYISRNKKVRFLDFFLLISFALFTLQTIVTSFPLRWLVMLVPIILLISARFISKINKCDIKFNDINYNVKKNYIIYGILLIYSFFNIAQLTNYFIQIHEIENPYGMHIYIEGSREINKYIPPGSKVYSNYATALAVENKIKPYYSYYNIKYANKESHILPMFYRNEINYAILDFNLFDDNDFPLNFNLDTSKVHKYIKDNFEIIAVIKGKDDRDGSTLKKTYIYKRTT